MSIQSIATGSALTAETWKDFVSRLRHHCLGDGVAEHCTAAAIFMVEARRLIYGISLDYTDKVAIIHDDSAWHSPEEYYNESAKDEQKTLDGLAHDKGFASFLSAGEYEQLSIIESLPDHTVTGWDERWEHVGTHFTKEAAEAFIARKKHDYRDGLRVYVEAQPYAWEFETIKNAIMDGKICFVEDGKVLK